MQRNPLQTGQVLERGPVQVGRSQIEVGLLFNGGETSLAMTSHAIRLITRLALFLDQHAEQLLRSPALGSRRQTHLWDQVAHAAELQAV